MVYEPSSETDLSFVKSMLQSANIPFSVASEEAGISYGRPRLYVAQRDADDARALIAEIRKADQEEWADPEEREEPEVPSFCAPAPLGQPSEFSGGFDPPSFGAHVLRVILFVVLVFLAIAALMFLLSKLDRPNNPDDGFTYAGLSAHSAFCALEVRPTVGGRSS
ncbi:MAG: DUF2007 domain-containing protein [Coriobacteriia bacterium]|nr:DUF2007 domain-containing protein [Coriobacteriia bacterium]